MSNRSLLPRLSGEDFDERKSSNITEDHPINSTKSIKKLSRTRLALQAYIAIIVTVMFLVQLSRMSLPLHLTGNQRSETAGGHLEYAYSRDFRYMSLDHKFDGLWDYGNMSALRVPEPKLGTGEDVDAGISMFHQLHCLGSFRSALQDAYEGNQVAFDWHNNHHWPHCLDYLRQTILCFADDTFELPRIVHGRRTETIDGAEDMRKCRPNKPLFELQNSGQHGD